MTLLASPEVVVAEPTVAGRREFIALVTSLMALTALAIDLMLPAFPDIRSEFSMPADSAHVAWIVTAFFLGLALGPLVYGPLSDRFGRRQPLFAGLGLYVFGAFLASVAPSFGWIVLSRVIWGLGAAAPRSLSLAMIRDRYEGDHMARLMSMIMAVFLLVPIAAPGAGAALIAIAPWRIVFWMPGVIGVAVIVWAVRRLPETLPPERRRPFTVAALGAGARAVLTNRQTMCFTIAITFLFGVMSSYLGSSELIVEDVYGYGQWFPLFFGAVAVLFAASALNNARLVGRLGVPTLLRRTAIAGMAAAVVLTVVSFLDGGHPNFWLFTLVLACTVPLAQGLMPNANSAAMSPMGDVAGMASAIIALVTTAGGAILGAIVSNAFDGTVRPFAVGVLLCMGTAVALVLFATRAATTDPSQ